jgi:hypothetical protein
MHNRLWSICDVELTRPLAANSRRSCGKKLKSGMTGVKVEQT